MNVYDFDHTIYAGDSTRDFVLWLFRRDPLKFLRHVPGMAAAVLSYRMGRIDLTEAKSRCFAFLGEIPDVRREVEHFWDRKLGGVRSWYLVQRRKDDVIISASPAFLIEPACRRIGVKHVIATEMSPEDGRIRGKNCKGREKLVRFQKEYPDARIDNFYSDHRSDRFMAGEAAHAWLVNGTKIVPWDKQ